ncbi:hypothetical protein GA566_04725 [Cupriavidus sp. SW-Y-13]|nr:hypothetical protein [Cupriavidus sp. SW-Y-13]
MHEEASDDSQCHGQDGSALAEQPTCLTRLLSRNAGEGSRTKRRDEAPALLLLLRLRTRRFRR